MGSKGADNRSKGRVRSRAVRQELGEQLLERFRRAAERRQFILDTVGRCAYAERLVTGCCERHYRCHHPEQDGNIYEPTKCNSTCSYYRVESPAVPRGY